MLICQQKYKNIKIRITMKKNSILFLAIILLVSCSQVKDIAYFPQVDRAQMNVEQSIELNDPYLKPKDLLSITVISSEPEASLRFNLISPRIEGAETDSPQYSSTILQNYLVDSEGFIDFPVIGKLKVSGLRKGEMETLISQKLAPFFSQEMPIITIRILNYSINVLGEVLRPGNFEITNEKLTIFEALALAGDMTIYGRRDNVKVLREQSDGTKTFYTLNINDKSIFNSPAFYLEQNDVVYVEPNQSRANSSKYGAAETYRISTLSVLISLATMAATIFGLTR